LFLVVDGLAEAGELQAQGVELGVGFLTGCPEHLLGIRANSTATWRGHLLGQFNHPLRG
jgi:hypothetical protein